MQITGGQSQIAEVISSFGQVLSCAPRRNNDRTASLLQRWHLYHQGHAWKYPNNQDYGRRCIFQVHRANRQTTSSNDDRLSSTHAHARDFCPAKVRWKDNGVHNAPIWPPIGFYRDQQPSGRPLSPRPWIWASFDGLRGRHCKVTGSLWLDALHKRQDVWESGALCQTWLFRDGKKDGRWIWEGLLSEIFGLKTATHSGLWAVCMGTTNLFFVMRHTESYTILNIMIAVIFRDQLGYQLSKPHYMMLKSS